MNLPKNVLLHEAIIWINDNSGWKKYLLVAPGCVVPVKMEENDYLSHYNYPDLDLTSFHHYSDLIYPIWSVILKSEYDEGIHGVFAKPIHTSKEYAEIWKKPI